MISAFRNNDGLQAMLKKSTKDNIFRSRVLLVIILLGTGILLAVAHFFAKSKLGAGFVGLGGLALWVARYYYFTKKAIYRKGGPFIEFEKEPSNHMSAVLANCVLGLIFIYLGTSIFFSH